MPIAEIARRYLAGESSVDLGKAYECSPDTIGHRLRTAGVRMRSASEAKGARAIGAVIWGPRATRIKTERGWRRGSRVIWERRHGKPPAGCRVIHIERNVPRQRLDRIDNLALISAKTAPGLRWSLRGLEHASRSERLNAIMIAALKAGDTEFRLGTRWAETPRSKSAATAGASGGSASATRTSAGR